MKTTTEALQITEACREVGISYSIILYHILYDIVYCIIVGTPLLD